MKKVRNLLSVGQHFTSLFRRDGNTNDRTSLLSPDVEESKEDQVLKAARKGNLASIKSLIRDGIDMKEFGHKCLVQACQHDRNKIVSYLIKRGVDINETNDGRSALHHCVMYHSPKCAKLLVDNGAQVDVICNGKTPLMMACDYKYESIMEVIIQSPSCTRAAKIEALEHMGATFVRYRDYNCAHGYWSRSLQERLSAEPGDLVQVKSQLTHPVYGKPFHTAEDLDTIVSSKDDMWMQALIIMEQIYCHRNPSSYYSFADFADSASDYLGNNYRRRISIAMYILDRHLQLHGGLDQKMWQPLTTLENIISDLTFENPPWPYEVVMPVLSKGVDMTKPGISHPTVAYQRPMVSPSRAVIRLVSVSIGFLAKCQQQMSEIDRSNFKQLISDFVLSDPHTENNKRPLHVVCGPYFYRSFHLEIVELLLEAGSDPCVTDRNGFTPLHYACGRHYSPFPTIEIVHLLLRAGADPLALNSYGKTPMDLMAKQGQRTQQ